MGRNSAIKHFDPTPPGQTMDLLDTKEGRLPIIIELLKSPWLSRASELAGQEEAAIGKQREETLSVAWDEHAGCPAAFELAGRVYRVDAVVQVWAVERFWWMPSARVSRRFWRVMARGGTYDLAYDRLVHEWLLVGIQD